YAALGGELARKMMVHLSGANPDGGPKVAATEDYRCLACHTNPALAGGRGFENLSRPLSPEEEAVVERGRDLRAEEPDRRRPGPPGPEAGVERIRSLRAEGVGCEACHGN